MNVKQPIRGYVYAVEYEDGIVKIGSTQNADKRFYSLQNAYRRSNAVITKVYVSAVVPDCRGAERGAMNGLVPCEKRKREVFDIPFPEAVERIQAQIKTTRHEVFCCTRKEVVRRFNNLETYGERLGILEEHLKMVFEMCARNQHAIESHADTML